MESRFRIEQGSEVDLLLATSQTLFQMADIVPTLGISREVRVAYSHLKLHCLRVRDCITLARRTSSLPDAEDTGRALVQLGFLIHESGLGELPRNAPLQARLHAVNIHWTHARRSGYNAQVDVIRRWLRLGSPDELIKRVEEAFGEYANSLEKKQPKASSGDHELRFKSSSTKPSEPTYDVRSVAQGLFDAMLEWNICSCPQGHAVRARLQLGTYRRSDPTAEKKTAIRPGRRRNIRSDVDAARTLNFDMFLSIEDDWHEVHVQSVTDTDMEMVAELATDRKAASHRQKSRAAGEARKAERLCKSIGNTVSHAWQRLVLRFTEGQLFHVRVETSTFWIDRDKEPVSLLHFLEERQDYFTEKTKRILSLIIGHAVLHLDGTSWLQSGWGSADVKFFQTTSRKTPLRPYIQVNLPKSNTATDPARKTCAQDDDGRYPDELNSGHRCPALIALAVVLIEVYFAKPFSRLAQMSGVPLERRGGHITLEDVDYVLDGEEENKVEGWRCQIPEDSALLMAVDNCLNPEIWEDQQGNELDSRTLKQRIYHHVIRLLEQHLASGFSTIPLDGIDGYARQMDFEQWGQAISDHEPRALTSNLYKSPLTAMYTPLPASTPQVGGRVKAQPVVPEFEDFIQQYAQTTSVAPSSSSFTDTVPVVEPTAGYGRSQFFDDEAAADGESSTARYVAELRQLAIQPLYIALCSDCSWDDLHRTRDYLRWRCEYEKVYDKFIIRHLQDSPPSRPVKVAILDTGIDRDHPAFEAREHRIKAKLNYYNESQKTIPDLNGHGTFTASLILDYAQDSDLYVVKIADRDNTTPNAEIVAKAINHAVDEWNVDIISLSFGWPSTDFDGYDALDDAITRADANKVLLFAAASNSGGRLPRAYPASSAHVICVHSTDTLGNASNFSPTAQPYSLNFATVGESVESAWPMLLFHERSAPRGYVKSRSGTSYATPIMAGIAAFLLQYARLHLPEQALSLKKKENMEALLKRCAERGPNYVPRDKYFYVELSLNRHNLFGRELAGINDEILQVLKR